MSGRIHFLTRYTTEGRGGGEGDEAEERGTRRRRGGRGGGKRDEAEERGTRRRQEGRGGGEGDEAEARGTRRRRGGRGGGKRNEAEERGTRRRRGGRGGGKRNEAEERGTRRRQAPPLHVETRVALVCLITFSGSQLRYLLLDIDTHQAREVAAEDLLFGLPGKLRIAVARDHIFRQLEFPEGVQRPARMPDGRLATVEDLILAAPEKQLAEIFGELAGCAHDKVERCGNRGVQVRVAYQLPADLINEGQADVKDDKVDVGEVRGSPVHVPCLCGLDGLRAERNAFVHADGLHAQFKRFLKDRVGDAGIIHAPGEGFAIVVAHIVELEGFGSVFLDLALHQVERLPTLQRVDRTPEYRAVRVLLCHCRAFLPLREAIVKEIGQRQRLRHDHIGP